ncbi:hypothetical protein L2E82_48816 [Cichorium intybus]|uniref:Uncharacterized protein n=1 Tax=Cichorium intybus TaxID=13427 RepID=A0ACB8YZV5_CICIN|nr:hypothetical protein L2E82_48816 [Cichorium intybus]
MMNRLLRLHLHQIVSPPPPPPTDPVKTTVYPTPTPPLLPIPSRPPAPLPTHHRDWWFFRVVFIRSGWGFDLHLSDPFFARPYVRIYGGKQSLASDGDDKEPSTVVNSPAVVDGDDKEPKIKINEKQAKT